MKRGSLGQEASLCFKNDLRHCYTNWKRPWWQVYNSIFFIKLTLRFKSRIIPMCIERPPHFVT